MRLPDPHRSRAILIGTFTYASSNLRSLPAVKNNLRDLHQVLTDPALGGLTPERCIVVPNPKNPREVFGPLAAAAKDAQDTLLVYYAGHGLVGPQHNELYLTLEDTETDALPVTGLKFDVVGDLVRNSGADNRILIMDCCFSGRAAKTFLPLGDENSILGQMDIKGVYTLTSSAPNRASTVLPGATYTAFTGALLTLARKGIPDGPEFLTMRKIYQEVHNSLQSEGFPEPNQLNTDTVDSLALTRNCALPGAAKPVAEYTPRRRWAQLRYRFARLRRRKGWRIAFAIVATIAIGTPVVLNFDEFASGENPPASATLTFQRQLKCTRGSVCLWPEPNYEGRMWKWTPKPDSKVALPSYLKNHVGSFDVQVEAGVCFSDTDAESEQRVPAAMEDWGWNYNLRFGSKMDQVESWCSELNQRVKPSTSSTG
ncbi:caspase family protein [Nonomuraea sp. NPDC048882]|uniref:caspase, EACC1-associated type n=1 Tax=unclassified Nonomuraea TaxID=2593643 RepID=UPI0033FAE88A